jgi:hypothetical protein
MIIEYTQRYKNGSLVIRDLNDLFGNHCRMSPCEFLTFSLYVLIKINKSQRMVNLAIKFN